MNSRKRLVHLATSLGLLAGGLVAAAPSASAATPTCFTGVTGVAQDGNVVDRFVSGNVMKSEKKTTTPLPFAVSNMMWLDSVKVSGGYVDHIEAIVPSSHPRRISLKRQTDSATMTATVTSPYSHTFSPRLVAASGTYYVYGVDSTSGDLRRWTRYKTSSQYVYLSAKTIAHNMGGLRTLSYSWTYQINGKYVDFLYGTTASGRLVQIRIPWASPGSKTIETLASSGFASYTGLSLSICNGSSNYLSLVAINRTDGTARWFTKPYVRTDPHRSPVVNRGLIAPEADWHLHATF